nr:MAG TPA: hypothetical protein [Caudoviricetes sp.]
MPHFFTPNIYLLGGIHIKRIDNEYRTESSHEVCYLSECGIRYEFVKIENGVSVWKYKKTKELGLALSKFWSKMK